MRYGVFGLSRTGVDLQFDALNTGDVQPVDLKAAGMAVPGRQIDADSILRKLGDQQHSRHWHSDR